MGFTGGGGEILDGSITLKKLSSDVFENVVKNLQENYLNDLINSNASGSNLNDYEDLFGDIFIDADGLKNSVDVGTTAIYDADTKTYNTGGESAIENLTEVTNTAGTFTTKKTIPINGYVLSNISNQIKINNGSYQNICRMKFNYNDATTGYSNEQNTYSTSYVSKTYTNPNTEKLIDSIEVQLLSGGAQTGYEHNTSCPTTKIDGTSVIVQIDLGIIPSNPTGHQVLCHNVLAGTGSSVDYNISFDDRTTWVTGQDLNTKNTEVHEGSHAWLQLNLNGNGDGNTAKASDYSVKLFYD